MSCTIDCPGGNRTRGFTLVEILVVVSLVALIAAMAGTSLLDQLRAQQVAGALQNARVMASAIEQVRPQLIANYGATFVMAPSYTSTLADFMEDMDAASILKIGLQQFVSETVSVLGQTSGNIYTITLTPVSTFVTLTLDESYAEFNFSSAAKVSSSSNVSWTVPHHTVHPSTADFRFINEINKR